jgi:hypothetical protein
MNVSRKADAAFMRALKDEDPPRYAALLRNMEKAAKRPKLVSKKVLGKVA